MVEVVGCNEGIGGAIEARADDDEIVGEEFANGDIE